MSLTVIKLAGELEIGRKAELSTALRVVGTPPGILLDFSEVTYADSTALAMLLRFRTEADGIGVPLAILIKSRQFARLIEYAGLAQAFAVFTERAAALTYLSNPARA